MMPTAIGIVILIVSTVAAILAGIAVFTNVRPEKPDDPRIGPILEGIEELKSMMANQVQKSLMTIEARAEKDIKDIKSDITNALEKTLVAIDKLNQEEQGQ